MLCIDDIHFVPLGMISVSHKDFLFYFLSILDCHWKVALNMLKTNVRSSMRLHYQIFEDFHDNDVNL